MNTHKVLRFVKYREYDEQEKSHLFDFTDHINLIKAGEKVGVFKILKDRM